MLEEILVQLKEAVADYKRSMGFDLEKPLPPRETVVPSLDGLVCPNCDGVFDTHTPACPQP